jgi:hypothetical protein
MAVVGLHAIVFVGPHTDGSYGTTYAWQLWDHMRVAGVGLHAMAVVGLHAMGVVEPHVDVSCEPHEDGFCGTTCDGSCGTT